jgi:hypothetical protein
MRYQQPEESGILGEEAGKMNSTWNPDNSWSPGKILCDIQKTWLTLLLRDEKTNVLNRQTIHTGKCRKTTTFVIRKLHRDVGTTCWQVCKMVLKSKQLIHGYPLHKGMHRTV